ncbi:MAG TPA: zf-HC2 domain-containing protein [Gemmatimonadales bacterium]|jgi:anti-sigma factor RsiW|nr:zf-HC2 domain-containing protein [Gemmatimonadales bacterium]
MQHPDDNLLTEWLDGELEPVVASEIDAHLAQCTACHARAQALRAIATEANGLLTELEAEAPSALERTAPPSNQAAPAERGSPVVLLPYNEMAYWRRSSWRRTVGIAATIVVAAGAGWFALRPGTPGEQASSQVLSNAPSPGAPPSVLDSGLADSGFGDASTANLVDSTAQPATLADATRDVADSETQVAEPDSDAGREREPVTLAQADTPAPAPSEQPSFGQPTVTPVAPRRERAPASAAAAFSSGISASQPQRVAELKATTPEREPLAIERDAQLSSRIGLDEAREQLGGNLHVIEGLRPEMVGLVPGRLVAGADPSRPVVRVVYLGDDGKTFFLDQQRVGDAAPSQRAALSPAPGSWMAGNVQLRLHGQLSQDSLDGLARRVK